MKAIQQRRFGSSEVLELVEIERPAPGEQQVLIRVLAAGVNPVDWKLRAGKLRRIFKRKMPYTPGIDVCGEVVEVGPSARHFSPGDVILGSLDARLGGGYAEFAVIDEGKAVRLPEGLSAREAAGLPCAGLTALQSIDRTEFDQESRFLVIGAAGGVGHLAVQIGRSRGARVNGVCSTGNLEWVSALGVNRAIDYMSERYLEEVTSYDMILDAVAVQSYWKCRSILKRRGHYITTLLSGSAVTAGAATRLGWKGTAAMILIKPNRADLASLTGLVEKGQLKVAVENVFPLDEARQAHDLSETGHVRGKIVLDVGGR